MLLLLAASRLQLAYISLLSATPDVCRCCPLSFLQEGLLTLGRQLPASPQARLVMAMKSLLLLPVRTSLTSMGQVSAITGVQHSCKNAAPMGSLISVMGFSKADLCCTALAWAALCSSPTATVRQACGSADSTLCLAVLFVDGRMHWPAVEG